MTSWVSGRFSQIGPVALDQVGNRVEPQGVHPHVEPEPHDPDHFLHHLRVVEIEIRLVGEEPVPVVGLGLGIPGPVGLLGVGEDDAGAGVLVVRVAPDVEVPLRASPAGALARRLEPGMLVGGVVDDQLDQHLHAALVRRVEERAEVVQGAVARVDADVVGDVVAVVAQRRGEERQQPEAGDAQVLQVVELLDQPAKVADAVVVGVVEGADVDLVDDRVLVPQRIERAARLLHRRISFTYRMSARGLPGDASSPTGRSRGRPRRTRRPVQARCARRSARCDSRPASGRAPAARCRVQTAGPDRKPLRSDGQARPPAAARPPIAVLPGQWRANATSGRAARPRRASGRYDPSRKQRGASRRRSADPAWVT